MFKTIKTVFFKEIKSILRDKRTFIISLFALLINILLPVLMTNLSTDKMLNPNVTFAASDPNTSFCKFLNTQENVTVVQSKPGLNLSTINTQKNFDKAVINRNFIIPEIIYKEGSKTEVLSEQMIFTNYLNEYISVVKDEKFKLSQAFLNELSGIKLEMSISQEIKDSLDTTQIIIGMLGTSTLLLCCIMGTTAAANELGAGEKDLGTLEPLLTTAASRTSIILGKLLTTACMGFFYGLCAILGLIGYQIYAYGLAKVLSSASMLLIISVLISLFYAAINLTFSVFSRSVKESSTYTNLLLIFSLLPSYFIGIGFDVKDINYAMLCIPGFNFICLIKEILNYSLNFGHFLIVLGWMFVYISLAVWVMTKIFSREEVVFRV